MLKSVGIILFCLQIVYGQSSNKISALKVHNDGRKEVGVQPLVWSENLEIGAKKYADYLASKDIFKHSESLKEINQGENLYSTTYFVFQENGEKFFFENTNYLKDASISWLGEKKDYTYAKIGDRKNNFSKIGHYTQMVWNETTQVGIAYSKSISGKIYVVARYYPAGNIISQFPY